MLAIIAGCATSPRARAVRASDEGAWEAAAAAYREALDDAPEDGELWVALGRVHLRMGEPAQARIAFEHGARHGQSSARVRLLIGTTHELERHYDEALLCYRQAIELAPRDAHVYRFSGARLLRWGNADAAEPWLARAVELDPDHAEAWNAWAIASAQRGDLTGAAEIFRRGIARHPEHRGLRLGLAATLINAQQHRAALAVYDAVAQRWPELAEVQVGRSLLLDLLGDPEAAEAALVRAVELDPADPLLRERLHRYRTHRAQPIQ